MVSFLTSLDHLNIFSNEVFLSRLICLLSEQGRLRIISKDASFLKILVCNWQRVTLVTVNLCEVSLCLFWDGVLNLRKIVMPSEILDRFKMFHADILTCCLSLCFSSLHYRSPVSCLICGSSFYYINTESLNKSSRFSV
jgi:hypothetical protein